MSRHMELSARVPVRLFANVGSIAMVSDKEVMEWPHISIPNQYLMAFDPLFEDEPWEGGSPRTYWGMEDSGIAKLDDWPAAKAAEILRRAISRVADDGNGTDDFWAATPKGVKAMLESILRITEYAIEHEPTASWVLYS